MQEIMQNSWCTIIHIFKSVYFVSTVMPLIYRYRYALKWYCLCKMRYFHSLITTCSVACVMRIIRPRLQNVYRSLFTHMKCVFIRRDSGERLNCLTQLISCFECLENPRNTIVCGNLYELGYSPPQNNESYTFTQSTRYL